MSVKPTEKKAGQQRKTARESDNTDPKNAEYPGSVEGEQTHNKALIWQIHV